MLLLYMTTLAIDDADNESGMIVKQSKLIEKNASYSWTQIPNSKFKIQNKTLSPADRRWKPVNKKTLF